MTGHLRLLSAALIALLPATVEAASSLCEEVSRVCSSSAMTWACGGVT